MRATQWAATATAGKLELRARLAREGRVPRMRRAARTFITKCPARIANWHVRAALPSRVCDRDGWRPLACCSRAPRQQMGSGSACTWHCGGQAARPGCHSPGHVQTTPGTGWKGLPGPSCRDELSPTPKIVASRITKYVKKLPHDTEATLLSGWPVRGSMTGVASERDVVVPSPSWPCELSVRQQRWLRGNATCCMHPERSPPRLHA